MFSILKLILPLSVIKRRFGAIIFLTVCFLTSLPGNDTLTIGYAEGPPFIYETENGVEGISVYLWEAIASELNLDFRFKKMSFNGILDSLNSGDIDLCVNALTVTKDRMEYMDFTFPFLNSYSAIAIREEGVIHKVQRFFKPILSLQFIGAFVLLILIIFLFGVLVWFVESRDGNNHFRKGIKGVWDGIWWSSVTVTTVGYGDKAPRSRMGKIFALLWMFIALIFISSLTAGLTSNLLRVELQMKADHSWNLNMSM